MHPSRVWLSVCKSAQVDPALSSARQLLAQQPAQLSRQACTAALCPVRIACTELQQLVRACNSVVFLSPTLVAPGCKRRCVEGSFIAFFSSAEELVQKEASCRFRMRMLVTATPI